MRSSVGFLMIAGGAFVIVEGLKYFTKPKAPSSTSTAVGGSGNSGGTPTGAALSGTAATNAQTSLERAAIEWTNTPQNVKDSINRALQATNTASSWGPDLAYIMRRESGYGLNNGPSPGGAMGPMQFIQSTWNNTVQRMPHRSTPYDIWNMDDSVLAAVYYIKNRWGEPQNTPWFTDPMNCGDIRLYPTGCY